MFSSYVHPLLLLLCSSLYGQISSGAIEHTVLRGVQTSLLSMYVPSKPFACLDGSGAVPFEFVNDDYCDCRDGSDEPGTSACPNGRFFCENKGYIGAVIPSHFVGDSICDCCDGSDEYETSVVCNNTCFELAQKNRAEREAKRVLHEAGVAKKKEIVTQSVALKAERQERLSEVERNLEKLESELKEKEELKQQAEAPETEAKERQQKLWDEQRAVREAIAHEQQMRDMFADLDTNKDSLVSIDELQQHTELDTDRENDFTVEEVRTILGGEKVNFDEFNTTVFEQISNTYRKLSDIKVDAEPSVDATSTPTSPVADDASQAAEEATHTDEPSTNEDDGDKNEEYEDDYEHHETSSPPVATSLEHEKHAHSDAAPDYDDETKRLIQAADHARNEHSEIERKVLDLKRQLEDLKKQANVDIGDHGEYSAFIDQCYDYDEREYTYRVCMFKDAKQIPKGGGSDVTVGYWESWMGPSDNKYLRMKYANGATCWNGPARSLTLTFRCGIDHRIVDVREPTRCEYAMIFETPSACDEVVASSSTNPPHEEF